MNYAPITFHVRRSDVGPGKNVGSGRAFTRQATHFEDLLSKEEKLHILERDDHTCQCCGFRSEKFQKILFKNFDPEDHSPENLMTVCIHCHQCFHLDQVAGMKSGVLIWLPELSQATLHHLARSIFVARISQGEMAEQAKSLLNTLMHRREQAKERLGTDDPMVLSTVMRDYIEPGHYKQRMKKLDGIRLMPLDRRLVQEGELSFNQFPQILAYWRSKDGPYGDALPKTWLEHYKNIFVESQAA
tara:strand:+ start:52 stop:783 length:732 start_codon:yes stop_codon:yes gene_type:complete